MRTALVYRRTLLAYSETFIRDQIQAYRTWRGILVGGRRVEGLNLDGLPIRLLESGPRLTARRVLDARYLLGLTPPAVARLRDDHPDLLHAHFGTDGIDAFILARALGIPLLVTLHGFDIFIEPERWKIATRLLRRYTQRLRRLAAQPDVHFVAVSDAVRRRAIEWGIAGEKITTCYIGVDTERFVPGPTPVPDRQPRVLFVGRLVEKKGCEVLLLAMTQVQRQVPGVELVIVGGGPLRADLEAQAHQLNVSADFRGVCSTAEVKQELKAARVFCLPSITAANGDAEGLPISILEAQASGVPVVTSARGGAEEGIKNGATGFAFSERDTGDLASKLIRLLTDDALASAMAIEGPRFVAERFDLRACTQKLERLYDGFVRGSIV